MVFVPKTSFKNYSSLKNQNTYIVTGVRTQLRLEQVDSDVLFLGLETSKVEKCWKKGIPASKFCTKGGVCVIAVAQSLI